LVQGDRTIRLSPKQIKTLPFLHAKNGPRLSERALIFFKDKGDFDPLQPWRVRLLVGTGAIDPTSFVSSNPPRLLPQMYVVTAAASPASIHPPEAATAIAIAPAAAEAAEKALPWRAIWSSHWVRIAILCAGLTVLTIILFLQDVIS